MSQRMSKSSLLTLREGIVLIPCLRSTLTPAVRGVTSGGPAVMLAQGLLFCLAEGLGELWSLSQQYRCSWPHYGRSYRHQDVVPK